MWSGPVLIYHLKNHYALIFALREWEEEKIAPPPTKEDAQQSADVRFEAVRVRVREVLTARKGQGPSEWVSFEEMRETLLAWQGYKVLSVKLTRPDPALVVGML